MPTAGWYPDPDGTPERLRYWDGQSWTDQVQPASGPAIPPGPQMMPPSTPGHPGASGGTTPLGGGYPGYPGGPTGPGGTAVMPTAAPKTPWWPWAAGAAVLLILAVIAGFFIFGNNRGTPPPVSPPISVNPSASEEPVDPPSTEPTASEPTQPTDAPSTAPSGPPSTEPTAGVEAPQCAANRDGARAGGLSVPAPDRWIATSSGSTPAWATCAAHLSLRSAQGSGWYNTAIVLHVAEKPGDLEPIATQAFGWMLSTGYPPDAKVSEPLKGPLKQGGRTGLQFSAKVASTGNPTDEVRIATFDDPSTGGTVILITAAAEGDAAGASGVTRIWSGINLR